ncbi:MAG TPA: hypothetical protein VMF12_14750 [Xanthobacteraceae bacterium]|nr:hypothetical protein [Xanthobacteraceae bacterium]
MSVELQASAALGASSNAAIKRPARMAPQARRPRSILQTGDFIEGFAVVVCRGAAPRADVHFTLRLPAEDDPSLSRLRKPRCFPRSATNAFLAKISFAPHFRFPCGCDADVNVTFCRSLGTRMLPEWSTTTPGRTLLPRLRTAEAGTSRRRK